MAWVSESDLEDLMMEKLAGLGYARDPPSG